MVRTGNEKVMGTHTRTSIYTHICENTLANFAFS